MSSLLVRNAEVLVTMDEGRRELKEAGLYAEEGIIKEVGPSKELPAHADVVLDLSGQILLPGFVNTHHHLDQTLTRNLPAAQNNNLFPWLQVHHDLRHRRVLAPTQVHQEGKAAASSSTSTSPPAASGVPTFTGNKLYAISANPGATNFLPGTGLLGRLIGFEPNSSVRIGGLWIGNADYLLTGGVKPRSWSFNSLLILDLNLDIEKLIDLTGSSVDASMLQFKGENTNGQAGLVLGYDGLTGPKPFVRTQLYQLWWRQSWFADKLVIRVGKRVPTIDFNNVSRPIAVSDESLTIPSVTGFIYTPIFKNPTLIGVAPGYYNSAYGITANVAPTPNSYFTCAIYDGALATGVQTGLDATPVFNGHYFMISEAGHAWLLGREAMPGKVAVGGWAQTGTLEGPGVKQNGSQGLYTFGSQRIWLRHPGIDNSGVSGFSSSVSMTRIP